MKADEIRKKYIEFFKKSPRNHKEISRAPLVPLEDPTTLFTSSGMQQLVPYLMGEPHPQGKRLVDSQPCFRTVDIDNVGNTRSLTFFEMLGNWSLGDYFKEEQLAWFWEFLTRELKLPKEKLYVAVFGGTKDVPKDEESAKIWKKLGVPEKRIFYYGVEENWWSRSGTPDEMPPGEIGGPDSEVFFEFTQVKHNPKFGKECHPNCECGRFLEIGNSVFIQYVKKKDGSLAELPQKNVDFGGGLERITAATKDDPDVFWTDTLWLIVQRIQDIAGVPYLDNQKDYRIVTDHMKAAVFLIANGVTPSNKQQGYILRRLLRRAIVKIKNLRVDELYVYSDIVREVFFIYRNVYFKNSNQDEVIEIVEKEVQRFKETLDKGMKLLDKVSPFDLFQTYGFPSELTEELYQQRGLKFDKEEFVREFKKHQGKSRTATAGMFKGGLADASEEVVRLHTATHLLHATLRRLLGNQVEQKGSNITHERLRFDFSYPQKLTDGEIKMVEDLVNEQIEKDLPMTFETKTLKEALDEGALAFFGEKYGERVKVYTIGDPKSDWFSKEVCGGPHVSRTSEIGNVKIKKQEKIGAGLIRIYATIA